LQVLYYSTKCDLHYKEDEHKNIRPHIVRITDLTIEEYLSELARPTAEEDFTAAMMDALRNYHQFNTIHNIHNIQLLK
jgi:hypothetical protein